MASILPQSPTAATQQRLIRRPTSIIPEEPPVDESRDLQGRVLIIRLELRGKEETKGHDGGGRKWYVSVPKMTRDYLRRTTTLLDHITVEDAATDPNSEAMVRFLESDLGLAGVKFNFRRDLVYLDLPVVPAECAALIRGRSPKTPGLPPMLRAFVHMFRRQLVHPAVYATVVAGLKDKVRAFGVGGLLPDYHDLFFPRYMSREVVFCVNMDEWAGSRYSWCTATLRRVERLGLHGALAQRTFNQRKDGWRTVRELCVPKKATETYHLVGVVLAES